MVYAMIQKHANHINLLLLLAFGNEWHTLEKLVTTTQTDMNEVRQAEEIKDIETLDNWVHHLRSSWMLIKAEQPLKVLYEAEQPLKVLYDAIHKESYQMKN